MFLSEWREFPSALCLARKKLDDSSRLDVVEIWFLFVCCFGLQTCTNVLRQRWNGGITHREAVCR